MPIVSASVPIKVFFDLINFMKFILCKVDETFAGITSDN